MPKNGRAMDKNCENLRFWPAFRPYWGPWHKRIVRKDKEMPGQRVASLASASNQAALFTDFRNFCPQDGEKLATAAKPAAHSAAEGRT